MGLERQTQNIFTSVNECIMRIMRKIITWILEYLGTIYLYSILLASEPPIFFKAKIGVSSLFLIRFQSLIYKNNDSNMFSFNSVVCINLTKCFENVPDPH